MCGEEENKRLLGSRSQERMDGEVMARNTDYMNSCHATLR